MEPTDPNFLLEVAVNFMNTVLHSSFQRLECSCVVRKIFIGKYCIFLNTGKVRPQCIFINPKIFYAFYSLLIFCRLDFWKGFELKPQHLNVFDELPCLLFLFGFIFNFTNWRIIERQSNARTKPITSSTSPEYMQLPEHFTVYSFSYKDWIPEADGTTTAAINITNKISKDILVVVFCRCITGAGHFKEMRMLRVWYQERTIYARQARHMARWMYLS